MEPFLPTPMAAASSFLLLLLLLPATTSSFSFNFPFFNSSTPQLIQFQNDSFFNKVLKLTKNEIGRSISLSVGRAFYYLPVPLYEATTGELADFTTRFSFVINAFNQSYFGDGLAFFLSPFPSTVPPASSGGSLGLVSGSTSPNATSSPTARFVAVEFDTFKNVWDPPGDHVGIDVNSVVSAATVVWNSSLKDGRTANAWVTYNASIQNLNVYLTYDDNPVYPGEPSLSYTIDLREVLPPQVAIGFSAATGSFVETHNVLSWEFSSSLHSKEEQSRKNRDGLLIGAAACIGFFLFVVGLGWFLIWKRRCARRLKESKAVDIDEDGDTIDDELEKGKGPKRFTYSELAAATKDFAEELKLGEGGFGGVYRGVLNDEVVAIKRVSRGSKQGKKEYIAEVKIISQLRHRNLVQLVGWCHGRGELILVYEFMPNGSLDTHLYDCKQCLPWPLRYKSVVGIASALLYLHEEWEECVVHRDVKPSNVMLDVGFNAKLGDFGLARLVDHDRGMQTTVLAGTMGYLAPECLTSGKASKESDVYALGVLALEVACGRRPVEPKERPDRVGLVGWVWDLYGSGRAAEAVDQRLGSEFDDQEMDRLMSVGLWCAHPDYGVRPTVRQVMAVLKMEAEAPRLPSRMPVPMYCSPPPLENIMSSFTYTTSSAGLSSGRSTVNGTAVVTVSSLGPKEWEEGR